MSRLTRLINTKYALSFLSVIALVLSLKLLVSYLANSAYFPINVVKVVANYDNVSRQEIEQILSRYTQLSFFSINSREIARKIKQIPWVERVKINKKWPDSLIITITEHQPFAVWNDKQIVTKKGLKFKIRVNKDYSSLPILQGNDKDLIQVLHTYQNLSNIMGSEVISIKKLIKTPSQSWRVQTGDGGIIELGSIEPTANFVRLSKLIPLLDNEKLENVAIYDLRYPHGIAIRWKRETGKLN